MKVNFIILFLTIISFNAFSQKINFILSIDDKIVSGNISNFKIIATLRQKDKKLIQADYYPGNLSISKENYDLLLSDEVEDVSLSFNYTEFCKTTARYEYNVNIKKGFLQHYYYILYIYNTDKQKYKKIFDPIKGEHYTYEFEYPSGGMRRIRKIKTDDCK